MLIVGELINSTRKKVRAAVEARDEAFIQALARDQAAAGAHWIDVNAGAFPSDEGEKLQWLIRAIRAVSASPLCIDSARPEAVEAGLAVAGPGPMVNSISAERERYRALIPLVKKYGSRVVALSLDDRGMTDEAEAVWQVADGLVKRLEDDSVAPDNIFIDPLVRPISVNAAYAVTALRVVEKLREAHPRVHRICGLSNVSYGLPNRRLLNQVFVVMAVAQGLDCAIIDPLDPRMRAHIAAAEALAGTDEFCLDYISLARSGKLDGMR